MSTVLLHIPGDKSIAHVIDAILLIAIELGAYALAVRIVQHWIPNTSPGNKTLGRAIGLILGIIAATFYARVLQATLNTKPSTTSLFIFFAIALNAVVTNAIYKVES